MIDVLDNILLSDNVVDNFHKKYNEDNFKNWLISIIPEVEKCNTTEQDNPWHIYNCLQHILRSVEEINKQTIQFAHSIRRMLAYTMFLHDIGKPDCKIRRYSKLYKREVDSFFNHNIAGVKIANRVLNHFRFNANEQETIKLFITEHDMFMSLTLEDNGNPYHTVLSEEYLKNKILELNNYGDGKQLLEWLILIGRADNKAQNPKMTGKSLELLDKMETMLKSIS